MSDIKVSIILPSLNVASYIKKCLKSVSEQTLQDIEIICVDGKSSDGTREIIAEYAARDQRIQIISTEQRSVGKQMNLGIGVAKGEYIGVVETDDYVASDMYEELYRAAKENQAQVVLRDYQAFWGSGKNQQILNKSIARKGQYLRIIFPKKEQDVFKNDMSIWTGIYQREFLLKNNIWQNETPGAAYQDTGFWFQAFACADRLLYLSGAEKGYRYRLDNPGSSVHNLQQAFVICEEFAFIRKELVRRGLFDEFKNIFYAIQFNRYIWNYLRIDSSHQLKFLHKFREDMLDIGRGGFPDQQQELLDEIINSPEVFHIHRQKERSLLHDLILSGRPVIVFGCGSDGIRLLNYLRVQNQLRFIACLVDNNEAIYGTTLFGLPIISLKKACQCYPDAVYFISSLNYGEEMFHQLLQNGVSQRDIWRGHIC